MFRLAAIGMLGPLILSTPLGINLSAGTAAAAQRIRPIDGPPGVDGYVFQQKAFNRLALFVQVHEYGSRAEMQAAFRALFPKLTPHPHLAGFTTWDEFGCQVHVVDPAASYQPAILGHELSHCLHGDFHPGQDAAR
jgi:hypothetical protein